MLNNLRRTWHWEKVKLHSLRIRSLLQDRVQYDIDREKRMVLAINYEIVSNATRAMTALRKVEELGVPADLKSEVREIRAWLKDGMDLPGIPRSAVEAASQSEVGRLYGDYEKLQGRFDWGTPDTRETGTPQSEGRTRDEGVSPSEEEKRVARWLERMSKGYGIPKDVIQRKLELYAQALRVSDQSSDWNADIDDVAREVGALTEEQIEAARTDRLTAVVNRVKVALVMEGWIPEDQPQSLNRSQE